MSYGQQLLKQYLARLLPYETHEEARPEWLEGLEIDFWLPGLRLAIEFQGGQHYVPRDGDLAALNRQRHNDGRKRRILADRGILFVRVEAIHLGYGPLVSRIQAVADHNGKPRLPLRIGRQARKDCADLDRHALTYRRNLKESFNCPTAHRRGGNPRKEAAQRRFADTVDGGIEQPQS